MAQGWEVSQNSSIAAYVNLIAHISKHTHPSLTGGDPQKDLEAGLQAAIEAEDGDAPATCQDYTTYRVIKFPAIVA